MTDRDLIEGIEEEFNQKIDKDELDFVIEWLFDSTCEDISTLDFLDMVDRIDDALTAYDMELRA